MQNTFKTISRFQYSSEAYIVKGLLESEGIKVFVSDNVTIDTDPIISNAIGGVKLKVPTYQVEEALEILSTIKQGLTDNTGNFVVCKNCNSNRVSLYSTITDIKSFLAFIFGFFTGTLPFSARYMYKCDVCLTEFKNK